MGLPVNSIPEDKLPVCWSDDIRMNALFAPFRIKTANPESWDMKMKFWSDMLRQWCKYKSSPLVSASDAKLAFQRKGRTPACLDIVVEEMLRNGDLSPVSKYQQILHNGPEGWVRWGARLAFKPAAFALTAVTSLLPARQALDNDGLPKASIDPTQSFVLESAVQEQATSLLDDFPASEERLGTVDQLMSRCGWKQSRETFETLLGWLVSQGYAVKKDDVVKIAETNKKPDAISDGELALVKLSQAEGRLQMDASRLEREVTTAMQDARAANALGNKVLAKSHLRKKHSAAQRLEKCSSALENVRQLMHQMRDVDVNSTILDTYKTSSEAMKRGLKEGGLNEDTVYDTMDDLKDVLDSYSEIERALSKPLDEDDAAELEAELLQLVGGDGKGGTPTKERKPAAHKAEVMLPSPPKNAPANKKFSEREFVFDGEERVIAELNELSVTDEKLSPAATNVTATKVPVAVPADDGNDNSKSEDKCTKRSKEWYPPAAECLKTWNNNQVYDELRQDERIHPGQPLQLDFSKPARLYGSEFAVHDHTISDGVWLYSRDTNCNDLAASTEYFSSESPGKAGGSFQMAPGGERKKSAAWTADGNSEDDLERRLRDLRGFQS